MRTLKNSNTKYNLAVAGTLAAAVAAAMAGRVGAAAIMKKGAEVLEAESVFDFAPILDQQVKGFKWATIAAGALLGSAAIIR